jgi:cell division septal protein FtsQ
MVNARLAEQKRDRRQRIGSIIVVTIALAALLWGLVTGAQVAGRVLFSGNDDFIIRDLDLTSDGRLQSFHIQEYAGLKKGMNLFALDIEKVRQALESVPVVSRVQVRRELPDTLVVSVTERTALARIGRDRDPLPLAVDREGYVLGPSSRSPHLPSVTGISQRGLRPGSVLRGPTVQDALLVLDLCDTTRIGQYIEVTSVDVSDPEYLDLRLKGNVRVLLSRERMEPNLRKVAATMQAAEDRGLRPVLLDATGENNVVARYR